MTTHFGSEIPDKQHKVARPQVLDALTNVRMDWELVAKGRSLLHYEGSIGLILFDIITKLNVPTEEQRFLLAGSILVR